MFLLELKNENKDAFLDLCVLASLSNGVFEEEQKETIKSYCRELNISEKVPECTLKLEDVAKSLNANTTSNEKKIILLEILALIKSDGVYDEKEKMFMNTLANNLSLDLNILSETEKLLEKYLLVCNSLQEFINN